METCSILFVCLGNICRSAMAEFILKALVKATFQDLLEDSEAMLS